MRMYPFSRSKLHDVNLRCRIALEDLSHMTGGPNVDPSVLMRARNDCGEIQRKCHEVLAANGDDKVIWLTGPQIGFAKECIVWASAYRNQAQHYNHG